MTVYANPIPADPRFFVLRSTEDQNDFAIVYERLVQSGTRVMYVRTTGRCQYITPVWSIYAYLKDSGLSMDYTEEWRGKEGGEIARFMETKPETVKPLILRRCRI